MTPEEWKARATAHLELLEDFWRDEAGGDYQSKQATLQMRFENAARAFPGLSWDEFDQMTKDRARKGKRGRPRGALMHKFWNAAEDARSLRELWETLHPDRPRPRPPIHPHDIIADRYGISRDQVDEYVNRAASRWPKSHRP